MNEDEALDRVVALWVEVDTLEADVDAKENEAQALRNEAEVLQAKADAKAEEAEVIWRPLLDAHPEWVDDLMSSIDPRVTP